MGVCLGGVFGCSLLNEATGSLLDDVQLVNTLQTSKVTATEVSEQLQTSEQTEIKIDTAREVRGRKSERVRNRKMMREEGGCRKVCHTGLIVTSLGIKLGLFKDEAKT